MKPAFIACFFLTTSTISFVSAAELQFWPPGKIPFQDMAVTILTVCFLNPTDFPPLCPHSKHCPSGPFFTRGTCLSHSLSYILGSTSVHFFVLLVRGGCGWNGFFSVDGALFRLSFLVLAPIRVWRILATFGRLRAPLVVFALPLPVADDFVDFSPP